VPRPTVLEAIITAQTTKETGILNKRTRMRREKEKKRKRPNYNQEGEIR